MHTNKAGEGECFFHTGRPAVTRCKQCGKPLCSDCRLVTEDGLFCGDKCAQTAGVFVRRSHDLEEKRARRRRGIPAGLIRFIIFLIIIAVVYKLGRQLIDRGFLEKLLQMIKKPA
ncbi:MAG: hypothetical protein NTY10_04035 [Candidatus Omnitrophica bacterium]|nr:hypothetical protein [Candidatus Omnitrophota bacterium]